MTTKEAAAIWGIKEKTISNYCNLGYIPNAEKVAGRWIIPDKSLKPLSQDTIRRLLIVSIGLKNNVASGCDWSTFDFKEEDIRLVYESLHYRKYIKEITNISTNRIPYELELTEKGVELIEGANNKTKDYVEAWNAAMQGLSFIISLLQLFKR